MTVAERSYVEQARRDKLETLRERGIDPFPYGFTRSHTGAQAIEAFDENDKVPVSVAGRIVAMRPMGKTTFGHLMDHTRRVQFMVRQDEVGDTYSLMKLLDLGDHIGIRGHMFATKTGEVTVRADSVTLLAKALRPLPMGKEDAEGIHHGALADPEMRYRERYADLAVHPNTRESFRLRARVIASMRRFLDDRRYVEVETPVLQPLYGGALARPFVTHYNALDTSFYLRIATELYLKRCIVGGLDRVYEIGKDFRNEGIDRDHNPEFTMLEFYEAYADYTDIMQLVEDMIHGLVVELFGRETIERFGTTFDFSPPWPRKDYCGLIQDFAGLDVLSASDDEIRKRLIMAEVVRALQGQKRTAPEIEGMSRTKLIDQLFEALVEPELEQPTFVVDFPIELSPLAKPKRGNPALAERFELFIRQTEMANAFSELNDPDDQRARFEAQSAFRAAGDAEAHRIDDDFVRALEYGMPPTGGCGVGVDRLMMLLGEVSSIRDVILFPMLRPES